MIENLGMIEIQANPLLPCSLSRLQRVRSSAADDADLERSRGVSNPDSEAPDIALDRPPDTSRRITTASRVSLWRNKE